LLSITNALDKVDIDDTGSFMTLLFKEGTLKETFDTYEIEGMGSEISPLIYFEAQKGNTWIDDKVFPMIYDLYGTDLVLERNTDLLGVFPSRGIFISNANIANYLLNGKQDQAKQGNFIFKYIVPRYVRNDYYELLNKAAAKYLNKGKSPSPQALRLLVGSLGNIPEGIYPAQIKYKLPGIMTVTTSENIVFSYVSIKL
jgi:hypothetical protein